jgi:hypothetical protein
MNFDFIEKLGEAVEKTIENNKINIKGQRNNIAKEEIELANKLNAIEEFTIDRFEENTVVLENRRNQEIINVNKEELPNNIKEGDIIKKVNGKYFIDIEETQNVEKRIKDKMDDLWN